jgi:glycosyltransferase involved in cell wall biosynthesis
MHVLLMTSLYAPYVTGGAEIVVENLARCLAVKGHRVTVVSTCSAQEGHARSLQDGVDVLRFFPPNLWWLYERQAPGDHRSVPALVLWRLRDLWNTGAAKEFGAILDEMRPDVVHTHHIKGFSPAIWREARTRGIPIVHTAHDYHLICTSGSLLRSGTKLCSRRCWTCRVYGACHARPTRMLDVFCSPSRFLLEVHRCAGILARRFELVRNGAVQSAASDSAGPHTPVRLLYLGQFVTHKGVEVLLKAVSLLPDTPFVLNIAGKGPLQDTVRDAARTDSRIRFHGFVSRAEKQKLLTGSDVLLFPSIWVENAPMAIAEALSHGLAVVATDLGASPEFVDDEVNGLLFPRTDARALAARIEALAVSPEMVSRLQSGARETARTLPSVESMTDSYLSLYESVLRSRPSERQGRFKPVLEAG